MLTRVLFAVGVTLLVAGVIFAFLPLPPPVSEPKIVQDIVSGENVAPPSPTLEHPPTPTALAGATPLGPQMIVIDAPPAGTLVGSPAQVKGRTLRMPTGGKLNYQVLDQGNHVIGNDKLSVSADGAGGGFFDAPLTFNLPQNGGTITARLFESNPDGSLAATADLAMFVQSQVQSISIDTPPPGTQVGTPMTLTGRVARLPSQGFLNYIVTNSSQQQIGAGTFAVSGDPDRPTTYVGSVEFNLPFDGDTITVRIYDQDQANGASVSLVVAPAPQQIIIDSPSYGALVGSPMTVKGTTVRFPANGQLTYRVTQNGNLLGTGSFTVSARTTGGSQFDTQVKFSMPYEGGAIQLTISDPTAPTGPLETTIDLDVRPQYQQISIDTPPAGAPVGSPMTITGRTNWVPSNGQLSYRVFDASNTVIGSGVLSVVGTPGTRGNFNGQVLFTEPPNGGAIRVELSDPSNGGTIVGSIPLNVLPPPPPQITIDTPPAGTPVSSPMTITGHTTYVPSQLSYRVRDTAGNVIGQGSVPFALNGRQASFNASLVFNEPAGGGNIVLEIVGPSPVAGTSPISTSIIFYVTPLQRTSISASTQTPISIPMPDSIATQTAAAEAQKTQVANSTAAVASIQTRQALITAATQTAAVAQIVTASVAVRSTPTPLAPVAVPTPAPPAIILAQYPAFMSTNISSSIDLTLNLAGLPIPTIVLPGPTTEVRPVTQVPLERTAVTALVTPIGTPGVGLSKAFGPGYAAVAIAKVIVPGFVMRSVDEEQSLEQPQIMWHWDVQPMGVGSQTVTVTIDVEWRPRNGGQAIRRQLWIRELSIDVRESPLNRDQASLFSLLSTLAGSGLSLPWLFEQFRVLRKRRTIEHLPDDEQQDILVRERKDDRVINAWVDRGAFDFPLEIGKIYQLNFNIDHPRSGAAAMIAFAAQKVFQSLPAEVSHAAILVVIETDDFTLGDDAPQILIVPREGPSINSVTFAITPKHDGLGQITALFSINNRMFQKMTITIQVGASAPASASQAVQSRGITVGSALALPARQHEHAIGIEIEPRGSGYRMKLRDAGVMSASLDLSAEKIAELVGRARHVLRSIVYTQINEGYIYQSQDTMIPPAIHEIALKTLAHLGYYLYQSLFYAPGNGSDAHELGSRLRWLSQHHQLIIEIDAERFVFPWGLIYDRDPLDLEHIDPEGFWGFKHSIEYLPQFRVAPIDFVHTIDVEDDLQLGFIFNTLIDDQLAGQGLAPVVEPQRGVLQRLSGVHVTYHPNRKDLYQLLNQVDSPVQLLYFYCHAEGKIPGDWGDIASILRKDIPRVMEGQAMRLADGAVLFDVDSSLVQLSDGSVRIMDLKIEAPTHRPRLHQAPLVFLNACQSAELSPYFYDGLVPYLIAKGARGVIGTEVDTPVYFAAEFAQAFLDRFTQGEQPLGKLLLDLRREYVLKRNNVLGLVYGLYSSGDIVVLRRSAENRE